MTEALALITFAMAALVALDLLATRASRRRHARVRSEMLMRSARIERQLFGDE